MRAPRGVDTLIEVVDAVVGDGDEQPTQWEDQPVPPSEATQYRARVARLNFLSMDRPGLQFCCKEESRKMAAPVNGDWPMLNKIARHVAGRPRVEHL